MQVQDSKGTTSYVYDQLEQLVKETRPDGMRKTMTTGSTTLTFHYDENKNVTYETDQNNQIVAHYTGSVVATYEYDAFGNLPKETGTVDNPGQQYLFSPHRRQGLGSDPHSKPVALRLRLPHTAK
ncbi:hypothetical protein ACFQ40_01865 [Kroppenstedtia eburnea]|uniref:hypothetical protein n=1 Tax=Kroppenstedtia eburnea TaxID=714067 RepID=UPI0036383CEC